MPVNVMYENDTIDTVEPPLIDELIYSNKIKKILRAEGWANVATDPIRGRGGRYEGTERRKKPVTIGARSFEGDLAVKGPCIGCTTSILDTMREPFVVLNSDLKVVLASKIFFDVFKVTPRETLGNFLYDLGGRQWDIPELRQLLGEILQKNTRVVDYEVDHTFPTIGHKIMRLNASRIYQEEYKEQVIFLAFEDITERKQLETDLMEYEERFRRLFEAGDYGVALLDKNEGEITHINTVLTKLLGFSEEGCIGKKLKDIGIRLGEEDFKHTIHNLRKKSVLYYDAVEVQAADGHKIDAELYLIDRTDFIQCYICELTKSRQPASSKLRIISSG